jgi:hypothetical protein
MKLYHATIEQRNNHEDVREINFNTKTDKEGIIEFIDAYYHGHSKVILIAMIGSETNDYFITDSYLKVQRYFNSFPVNKTYFLFEEPTYEEAFEYCKDHCEIHELGLNP